MPRGFWTAIDRPGRTHADSSMRRSSSSRLVQINSGEADKSASDWLGLRGSDQVAHDSIGKEDAFTTQANAPAVVLQKAVSNVSRYFRAEQCVQVVASPR